MCVCVCDSVFFRCNGLKCIFVYVCVCVCYTVRLAVRHKMWVLSCVCV